MLYRFCFLDAQDRIAVQEEIEAKSLMDAIARAYAAPTQTALPRDRSMGGQRAGLSWPEGLGSLIRCGAVQVA